MACTFLAVTKAMEALVEVSPFPMIICSGHIDLLGNQERLLDPT